MADSLVRVEAPDHFLARLDAIAAFPDEVDAPAAFDRLLDDLETIVIPNLARFPQIGRRFVDLAPRSVEALGAIRSLPVGDIGSLREYLHGDYLVLYMQVGATAYLLTIRHHREMGYDFARVWPGA